MLIKLLEAIESHIIESGACGDVKRILNACGETLNCAEYRDCEECEAHSLGFIAKLKEEASEQTVEYINLDALDSLKYKLKEKYDVLFNKFEVTVFERGELNAITQTLYLIDDIVEKQSLENKTSDKTSETSSV